MTELVTQRVVVRAAGDVDRQAACLSWVRLERRDGAVYVECAVESVAWAATAFARAGLDLEPSAPVLPPQGLRAAVVSHLAPFRGEGIVDVVTVRGISLGEATAWARATRWPLPYRQGRTRERVRALLHGDDVAFRWRRLVFADPAVLRSRRLHGARPVVFDRDALDGRPDRVAFASAAALAAWLRQ